MGWGLMGQEGVCGALAAMMKSGRLPHALLLTGATGSGKNSLARALAAAINCGSPEADGGPCGACLSCQKIAKDVHPDVHTLAPAGRAQVIKMEDVSALRAEMAFRPYEGRSKVFIIRQADRLGAESGNALLKTLEEPPPDSLLILTSASEAEVMSTILSRCLRLKLAPLSYQAVLGELSKRRGLAEAEASLLAALANGALGSALTLDLALAEKGWLEISEIMADPVASGRLARAWQWTDRVAGDEENIAPTLNLLRLWWRQTIRLRAGESLLEGPSPQPIQLQLAAKLTPTAIERLSQAQSHLENSLSRFVKPEMAFENYWLSVFLATSS